MGPAAFNRALLVCFSTHVTFVVGAESAGAGHPAASQSAAAPEEHGLSRKAGEIGRVFGFPITNSMLVSWIAALGLIAFAQLATRNIKTL